MPQNPLPITLLKGDKAGSETDYRDNLPVNVSGVVKNILGAQGYMLQQPGLTQYGTTNGIDRGGVWNARVANHFRVSGGQLIEVAANGASTNLGAVTGTDTASMPYSFNTQAVVANGRYYLYDTTVGFRQVTDPDLGSPIDCIWVDGYYFFTDGDFIFHTDLADESAIDPLKFATSEFSPDPSLGLGLTVDDKVIVFNRYTTEYFVNTASANFAFTRVPSRAIKTGIVGTHCKAEISGVYYIMGGEKDSDVSIYGLGVGSATNIASREVVKVINQYNESELSTAVLESRIEDEYPYLIVHLPNEVLLFNFKVAKLSGIDQAWSILKSDVAGNAPWRAKHGVFEPRKGKFVYGDKLDSTIAILDETVATHYGELAECILFTPYIWLEEMSIDELNIQTIPGFNTVDDATVFVSLTYDGVTFGTEHIMEYGAPSAYGQRFILYRLGYVDNWFALKLRWATTSRMVFSLAKIMYG